MRDVEDGVRQDNHSYSLVGLRGVSSRLRYPEHVLEDGRREGENSGVDAEERVLGADDDVPVPQT
jgi:hypothetical protein